MRWERRRQKRGPLEEFVFIQIERDEGGRVLNVSEGGLGFEVFSPIPQNGPLYFWLSSNLRERIEAFGEVAWTDAARRVGGLKFLKMKPQDRERIGAWVKQSTKAESSGRQPIPMPKRTPEISPLEPSQSSASMTSFAVGPLLNPAPPLSNPAPSEDKGASENTVPEASEARSSFYASRLVPLERFLTATRRSFLSGVLIGMMVSAAVAIPAFKYSANKKQITESPAVPNVMVTGKSDGQLDPPRTAPSSGAAPFTNSAAGNAPRPMPPGSRSANPFGFPSQAHAQRPRRSLEGQVAAASSQPPQPVSPKSTSTKKTAATPQELWASVQAGNTKAAVALADLYIRGDGVPVNCNQARVLLLVASEKSNADAIRKLQELDKAGGCTQP
jgi:PilZ domain